jgi:hypothetical protein
MAAAVGYCQRKVKLLLAPYSGDREVGSKVFFLSVRKCAQLMKPAASFTLDIHCMNSGDPLPSGVSQRQRAGASGNQETVFTLRCRSLAHEN